METIDLSRAGSLTSPNPVTLVCSTKADGSANLATVSWWTILSFNPEMLGFAMARTSFTGETVRRTGRVVITVPGAALARATMGCGMTTGRDTDKAAKFRIELVEAPGCGIKIPVHSRLTMVCTLKECHEVGDHIFHVCTVDKTLANENEEALFAWKGYAVLKPAKEA